MSKVDIKHDDISIMQLWFARNENAAVFALHFLCHVLPPAFTQAKKKKKATNT